MGGIVCLMILWAGVCAAQVWQAPDQERAKERAKEVVPFVKEYQDDCQISRRICLMDAGVSLDDVKTVYFLLDSPISKEARCTTCHAGYGWKDASFDFTDKTRIDCLVCHDTTGTYRKDPPPPGAGMPSSMRTCPGSC